MKILGVLPAVGSGLDTMAKAGQLGRLLEYVKAWRTAFDEIDYFSYLDHRIERAHIRRLAEIAIGMVSCDPGRWSPLRALWRPLTESWAWRDLSIVRCMNLLAAIPALTANAIWGVPFVVSLGADYEAIARIHGDHGQAWKWRLLRALVVRRAAAILVPSRAHYESLMRRYPRAVITYHPNWVDLDLFRPLQCTVCDGVQRVYYWGRLVKEKNLVLAARACRAAGATLCCIGDGPEVPAIREARGAVSPACDYERLPITVAMADAFIIPSLSEGHPKALLEAMALGLPCLVSDGVPGSWPGQRFDPTSETSMTAAVRAVLDDRAYAQALGEAGRHLVERDFDKKRLLKAEIDLLTGVAR